MANKWDIRSVYGPMVRKAYVEKNEGPKIRLYK